MGQRFDQTGLIGKKFILKSAPAIITKAGEAENPMKTVLAGKNG